VGERENEDMDLWVRIGLDRPLVVSSRITMTYYKTSPQGKPRFQVFPRHILSCVTALHALEERDDLTPETRDALYCYIGAWNKAYYWKHVRNGARLPLREMLSNSGARRYAPFCYWTTRTRILWGVARMAELVRRPFYSRVILGYLGGTRRAHGVVMKLVYPRRDH